MFYFIKICSALVALYISTDSENWFKSPYNLLSVHYIYDVYDMLSIVYSYVLSM